MSDVVVSQPSRWGRTKKTSLWKQVSRIAWHIEYQAAGIHIPTRGHSPEEIAGYILKHHRGRVSAGQERFLKELTK